MVPADVVTLRAKVSLVLAAIGVPFTALRVSVKRCGVIATKPDPVEA
jgi:hypothetical protein